jgi:hypothetical protein
VTIDGFDPKALAEQKRQGTRNRCEAKETIVGHIVDLKIRQTMLRRMTPGVLKMLRLESSRFVCQNS